MLKTRITEQYGLKVPFINAGMAFIATAPLVRAVCKAGGMGMLGAAAMPPGRVASGDPRHQGSRPRMLRGRISLRSSAASSTSRACVEEKVLVVAFFWDDPPDEWLSRLRAAGS